MPAIAAGTAALMQPLDHPPPEEARAPQHQYPYGVILHRDRLLTPDRLNAD